MSLKLIKFNGRATPVVLAAAGVITVLLAWSFVRWNFADAVIGGLDLDRPEARMLAEWLAASASNDPRARLALARVLERTFDAQDAERALKEYEAATRLAPHHYGAWLTLGRARELNGDTDGAETAYRRALDLAPNYAATQWAYGNFLVRRGRTDEGLHLMAAAAATRPDHARAAVGTAMQIFDHDLAAVRRSLGDTDPVKSAMAEVLASRHQYDEAFDVWKTIAGRGDQLRPLNERLVMDFLGGKRFRLAAAVVTETGTGVAPQTGQIANGSFEEGVKLRDAGFFEWNIAEGADPQVGLSDSQPRTGRYCLWLAFNSFETAAFRSISQTVPVEPGATYQFEAFYRSDLKTDAAFKFEILEAASGGVLGGTAPMLPAAAWTRTTADFSVPPNIDGIIIRVAREGCAGVACPVTGRLLFDDLSLTRTR